MSIEEQVAQLTEEQQDQILKIGKKSTVIGGVIIALMVLWILGGLLLLVATPVGVELGFTTIGLGIIVGAVVGFGAIIGMTLIIKRKYPYYSDKKLEYIKKMRKG